LELYQKIGDQFGVALSTFHLGIVQSHQHNLEMAVALFEQSIYQFRQFGDLFFIARVSNFLGQTYQKLDDLTRALFFYQQSLHFDTEVQFWNGIIEGWFDIGNLYLLQNDFEQASQCFEESVQASIEYSLIKFNSFYMSGLLAIKLNNYRLAYQRFSYLLNLGLMTGTKDNYGTLLLGLSVSAAGMDDPQHAARLNGAAQAIFATTRESYPEKDRQEFEMHLQKARDQLGEPIYESLQRTGESMGVERAIKYALEYGESIS
jgi:tetratricopeptide (TPR) repeat protein